MKDRDQNNRKKKTTQKEKNLSKQKNPKINRNIRYYNHETKQDSINKKFRE